MIMVVAMSLIFNHGAFPSKRTVSVFKNRIDFETDYFDLEVNYSKNSKYNPTVNTAHSRVTIFHNGTFSHP